MKLLIALAVLLCPIVLGADIGVGNFIDTDQCYSALDSSDVNGDGKIDADEYVIVNQLLGPTGFVSDISLFQDLPLIIQGTFFFLACMCTSDPSAQEDCCIGDNASLNTNGTAPGQTPTSDQALYLYNVCLQTQLAIENTLGTEPPTFSPSMTPSEMASESPTVMPTTSPAPSYRPSISPSEVPSSTPSNTITNAPSTVASNSPTTMTSNSPSSSPSTVDSSSPSTVSSVAPSADSSDIPTAVASPAPSLAVSAEPTFIYVTSTPSGQVTPLPTLAPQEFPTSMPSATNNVPVLVDYDIGIENGKNVLPDGYLKDLQDAMDILAQEVTDETFDSTVVTEIPTRVVGFSNKNCPNGTSPADLCQVISASITLRLLGNVRRTASVEGYDEALENAIKEGRLQAALDRVNSASPVRVLTGTETAAPTSAPIVANRGLSGGAIGGIVAAAAFGILVVAGVAYLSRQRVEKEEGGAYFPGSSQQAVQQSNEPGAMSAGATLGATTPDYGKKSKTGSTNIGDLEEGAGPDIPPTPLLLNESNDSSSNAGDSGWSSSAGVSSLRSGSFESMEGENLPVGSTLAKIGAASGMAAVAGSAASRQRGGNGTVADMPVVTRDDLDSAIDAGDWAAVGATAALLAAASDSQSFSSRSRRSGTSMSRGGSSMSSMDAARAAELDHLVDAGDWEGVVLAAAKFEATEDSSSKASQTGGSATGSSQYSGTGSQGYSPSTSVSESPSKTQKRNEIREEVEALVRRVVPEEIGNVDEMMMQFKGREEELVETLRTMQERQVAQKARVQGQKQAKRDAKMTVAAGGAGLPAVTSSPAVGSASAGGDVSAGTAAGIAIGAAAAAGVAAGLAAIGRQDSNSSNIGESEVSSYAGLPTLDTSDTLGIESGAESDHSNKRRRTALELAIEAGDWEAVGEAAAMMSDTSVTTASSTEIDNIAFGSSQSGSRASFSDESAERLSRLRSGVNAERAAELDQMIDRGDWTGVVAAASLFASPSDRSGGGSTRSNLLSATTATTLASSGGATAASSNQQQDRQRQINEEMDALAQAEIWMAIAEQSKQEGQTDVGASDAADWAIARSLSALKNAEQTGELQRTSGPSDAEEAASVASSQDRSV